MNAPAVSPAEAINRWMSGLDAAGDPEPITPAPVKEPDGPPDAAVPAPDAPVVAPPAVPVKPAVDAAPAKPADDLPEDKWPRSAQEWKKFKEIKARDIKEREDEIAALRTERDDIRKKISEAKSSPELEALVKERDEYSERLRLLDVEKHPKFVAYFHNKTQAQVDLAKRIVGAEQADQAAKLLALPDSPWKDQQLEEMLSTLGPIQQSRFGSVLNTIASIEDERQSEIQNARANFDKMTAEQTSHREQQVKGLEKTFTDAVLKAQETNPVFSKREGDHAWNSEVEKRIESARNLFFGKGVNAEQVIRASLDAAALPTILAGYEAMYKENEGLKAQIAELSKASPGLQSGNRSVEGAPQSVPIKSGMRPDAALAAWMKNLTAE